MSMLFFHHYFDHEFYLDQVQPKLDLPTAFFLSSLLNVSYVYISDLEYTKP